MDYNGLFWEWRGLGWRGAGEAGVWAEVRDTEGKPHLTPGCGQTQRKPPHHAAAHCNHALSHLRRMRLAQTQPQSATKELCVVDTTSAAPAKH